MGFKARKEDLIVEHLDDETLIYDLRTDKAHCLNAVASFVWKHCNGRIDAQALARKLSVELGQKVDRRVVDFGLQELKKARLIEAASIPVTPPRITRRDLIASLGRTAAIPLVMSITAPNAAAAVSCLPPGHCGQPRTNNRCCCNGNRCNQSQGKCNIPSADCHPGNSGH